MTTSSEDGSPRCEPKARCRAAATPHPTASEATTLSGSPEPCTTVATASRTMSSLTVRCSIRLKYGRAAATTPNVAATRANGKFRSNPERAGLGGRPPWVPKSSCRSTQTAHAMPPQSTTSRMTSRRPDSRETTTRKAMTPSEPATQTRVTNHAIPLGGGARNVATELSTCELAPTMSQQHSTITAAATSRRTSLPRRLVAPSPRGANTMARQASPARSARNLPAEPAGATAGVTPGVASFSASTVITRETLRVPGSPGRSFEASSRTGTVALGRVIRIAIGSVRWCASFRSCRRPRRSSSPLAQGTRSSE